MGPHWLSCRSKSRALVHSCDMLTKRGGSSHLSPNYSEVINHHSCVNANVEMSQGWGTFVWSWNLKPVEPEHRRPLSHQNFNLAPISSTNSFTRVQQERIKLLYAKVAMWRELWFILMKDLVWLFMIVWLLFFIHVLCKQLWLLRKCDWKYSLSFPNSTLSIYSINDVLFASNCPFWQYCGPFDRLKRMKTQEIIILCYLRDWNIQFGWSGFKWVS